MENETGSVEHLRQAVTQLNAEVLREIVRAVWSLQYGAVEITVHESRVVQIERREKSASTKATAIARPLSKPVQVGIRVFFAGCKPERLAP